MFLLLIAFVFFTIVFLLFSLLPPVQRIFERAFFTLRRFLPWTPSCDLAQPTFIKAFLWPHFSFEGYRASHWGSKHRPIPSVCLNHTLFRNYIISTKLYLNLLINYYKFLVDNFEYVDKLLVGKTLINFKHFSQKYYHLIDCSWKRFYYCHFDACFFYRC